MTETGALPTRLWIYQSERFPIFKTGVLVAFFTAATLCVSAQLADRPLPSLWTFVAVWMVVLFIFFQMRVADEHKDFETDSQYRPERAVPRGLVKLSTLTALALLSGIIAVCLTLSLSTKLLLPLGLVWLWLALMTVEFFVPNWIKARPFIYLISHMAIIPIIDFYVSAAEWLPRGDKPGLGLWLFYGLSFVNGCVLELGRKIWAPENERPGVETYSASYGPARAIWAWAGCCVAAAGLLLAVAAQLGTVIWVAAPTALALIYILKLARDFARDPTPSRQNRIDRTAGIWILLGYGLAGFVPLLIAG